MAHVRHGKTEIVSARTRALLILLGGVLLFALLVSAAPRERFVSVEMAFTDRSLNSGGLIVPASCPSYAHYSGECNVPPAPNPATNCGIAISPNSISSGGSATLGWSANTSFGLFTLTSEGSINNGVGAVAVTGTLNVSPTVSTVYTYSGTQYFLAVPIRTFSCSAAITVAGQPPQEEGGSCSAGYYCSGSDLYYRNDTCTSAQFIQNCPNGCSSSACLNPPPPNALIRVVPGLVQAGETTQVEWSAANVLAPSCSVVGSNGDQWDDSATGNQTSSPIFTQTTYTLSCTGTNGAAVTETATVNILPIFEET